MVGELPGGGAVVDPVVADGVVVGADVWLVLGLLPPELQSARTRPMTKKPIAKRTRFFMMQA